jgi:sugar/nucleoside kinase (ribokinase family)
VDTCGAGDAFAAGVLYALLRGVPLRESGAFGARVASAVISKHGARLCEDDATHLAAAFEVATRKPQLGR